MSKEDPIRLVVKHTFLELESKDNEPKVELETRRKSDSNVGELPTFLNGAPGKAGKQVRDKRGDVAEANRGADGGSQRSDTSEVADDTQETNDAIARSSLMSIMTGYGWDDQELPAWARASMVGARSSGNRGSTMSHRGSKNHRGSYKESMSRQGSDRMSRKGSSRRGSNMEDQMTRHASWMSYTTDMGDYDEDYCQFMGSRPPAMPFTPARGSDAGSRVPPSMMAPPPLPGGMVPPPAGPGHPVGPPGGNLQVPPCHSGSWPPGQPPPPMYYPHMPGMMPPPVGPLPPPFGGCWPPGCFGGLGWPPPAPYPAHSQGHAGGKTRTKEERSRTTSSVGESQAQGTTVDPAKRTTVMLRNMPEKYLRDDLTRMLDNSGFTALYDFVYMPMNFRTKASFGYAFVNMVSHDDAQRCHDKFQGFKDWGVVTEKVCEVSWSDMHQGLSAHIDRYRNSPVMHESVPDEYKPVMYSGGTRATFPAPTKKIRQPRIRRLTDGDENDDAEDPEDGALSGSPLSLPMPMQHCPLPGDGVQVPMSPQAGMAPSMAPPASLSPMHAPCAEAPQSAPWQPPR